MLILICYLYEDHEGASAIYEPDKQTLASGKTFSNSAEGIRSGYATPQALISLLHTWETSTKASTVQTSPHHSFIPCKAMAVATANLAEIVDVRTSRRVTAGFEPTLCFESASTQIVCLPGTQIPPLLRKLETVPLPR